MHSHSLFFNRTGSRSQGRCVGRSRPETHLHAHVLTRQPVDVRPRQHVRANSSSAGQMEAPTVVPATHVDASPVPDSSSSSSSGGCPFLSSLPTPPPAHHPWWTRLQQLSNAEAWQQRALGADTVVLTPSELGLAEQVVVGDAELVKAMLNDEGNSILQGNFLKGFRLLIGDESLLTVQEPKHKYLRGLMMPAFDKPAIERLIPRMQCVLTQYLERWCDMTSTGQQVLGVQQFKAMTFSFIIAVILGYDIPEEELLHLNSLYQVWAAGLLGFPYLNLPFTRFGKAMRAREQLMVLLQARVDAARQQLQQGRPLAGILGSLVTAVDEDGHTLTDKEINENLLLLLLAGHDTSAITLTNVMAHLQGSPAALQELRREQERTQARHGPGFSGSALKDMVYAEAVIRETLRLKPVVPALSRQAKRDFEMGGFRVKEGQYVNAALASMAASDPRFLHDEPSAFKPDRMLTPEGQKPGSQMPFGYGPRFCAGYAVAMAEMKVFLALLARGYDFSADTDTVWERQIGLVPKNQLPMSVVRLQ